MHEQESYSDKRARLLREIDQRLEELALALEVHGPMAATIAACRELSRSARALELRNLLRSHGFTPIEIAELMQNPHPPGCACWTCVIALNAAVRRRPERWRKARLRLSG